MGGYSLNRIKKIFAVAAAVSLTASTGLAREYVVQLPAPADPVVAPAPLNPRAMPVGPRYAAVLMDAHSGEILYANAFRELRHPASITKVMTLFLTFDALAAGTLKLTDPVIFSPHAVSQRPSKLGIEAGHSITVDQAIRVVAVKSANDVAMALAEKIGGNEKNFVAMMNRKARLLGMHDTVYANPSGLPDPNNVTSAYDIALLSSAMLRTHPTRYAYFSQRNFAYGKQTFENHNHLLGKVVGMDGIKTGYTVDAGFTLAASALRDNRRLIAVVLGEPSISARNRDATALLEAGFTVLKERANGVRVAVEDALPQAQHPAFRTAEPVTEQGSNDDAKVVKKTTLKKKSGRKAPARKDPVKKISARKTSGKKAHASAQGSHKTSHSTHQKKQG